MLDKDNLPDVPYGHCQCGCGEQTPIATHTRTNLGHVKGQPIRFIRGHSGKFAKPNRKRPERVVLRPPVIDGDVAYITLASGDVATIDAADADIVGQYNWSNHGNYAQTNSGLGVLLLMHRLVMDAADGVSIDHIDGNPLNNRRANLRVATHRQNIANIGLRRNNRSGFIGVSRIQSQDVYRATIRVNGRQEALGVFDNPEDAAIAYDQRAREVHGEYARVNFPEPGEQSA